MTASPQASPPRPARQLVLVSGPPAAGKTTLAGPLAAELGFALLAKDRIKETLHDALGLEADLAWSRRLGAAAMELLWALAADAPAVVLEANFWPDSPLHGERVRALGARVVEVHCSCPLDECRRRYAERASARHSVHVAAGEVRLAVGAAAVVDGTAAVVAEPAAADGSAGSAGLSTEPEPVGLSTEPEPAGLSTEPVGLSTEPADGPTGAPDVFARSAQPLQLGPVVTVDTSAPVDVAALAAAVRELLAE